MLDTITLEEAGVPSVLICAPGFVTPARLLAAAHRMDGLKTVVADPRVPYMGALELGAEARKLLPEVIEMLLGSRPGDG